MSEIRVSVQWKNPVIFAGERVECKIIFKNISQAPRERQSQPPSSHLIAHASARDRWKEALPLQRSSHDSNIKSSTNLNIARTKQRTHRSAVSLNNPFSQDPTSFIDRPVFTNGARPPSQSHRKSVSIICLNGDASQGRDAQNVQIDSSRRSRRAHTRAASLQVLSKRTGNMVSGQMCGRVPLQYLRSRNDGLTAPVHDRATTMPIPFLKYPTLPTEQGSGSNTEGYYGSQQSQVSGSAAHRHSRKPSENLSNFRFPRMPASAEKSAQGLKTGPDRFAEEAMMSPSSEPYGSMITQDALNPVTRILSPASMIGTPRSSGDYYSLSNNSTETMASEYFTQDTPRLHGRASNDRLARPASLRSEKPSEVLMMGYGQITGSYILDGSLVDQAPFEEVKRKGIIGSQGGGGVVRSDSIKRESGFFGALGLGHIGDSLGGLLGGNELSTIKEEKSSDKLKSIPILSTPQAILFVNLQLGPGESRTYSYSQPLPKGIPPTHKGRALKVSYSLMVGTQRAAKFTQQHHLRQAKIPFRVMPSVNGKRFS